MISLRAIIPPTYEPPHYLAAGFLSSPLANQFAREGHQIRGPDDLSTGNPQAPVPDVHFTRRDELF